MKDYYESIMKTHDEHVIDEQVTRLLAIIDNASDFIGIADKNGHPIFVNAAGRQMMSFTNDEDLSSLHFSDFHPPETFQFFQHTAIPVANKQGVWRGESIFLSKNGESINTLQTLVAHRDESGKVLFYSTTAKNIGAKDISELKQQQSELLQSQERYQALFNNTQEGIAVYQAVDNGNDFIFVDFNHTAEKIESVTRDKLLGKRVTEAFPGIKAMGLLNIFKQVWETGQPESFPVTFYSDNKISGWRANYVYRLNTGEIVATYHDETKLKQAEEQLYASELQKRLILQYLPDLVWLKDVNGSYLACNPAFERFLGAPENKIIGKTDYDFVDKELADFFRQHDRKAIDAGQPMTNEEWVTFADDGHTVLLKTTKTSLKDPNGEILGVLGIGHDVTEYRQHADQLKRSLSLLEAIIESTDNAMFVVDNQRNIIKYNSIFIRIWKIPKVLVEKGQEKEVLSYVLDQLIEPEQFEKKVNHHYRHPEIESFGSIEFKDGRVFDCFSKPMYLDDKVIARVWSFRDISKQKQTEYALRENEARFRSFFEKNSSVMLLIQPATGEIVAANDRAVKYYGYTHEELLSKPISQLNMLPPEQVAAERAAALQEQRNYFRFPHKLANGEIRDVEVYSTPIKTSGHNLLFSIVHDITARRLAEKTLEFHLLFQKNATEISIRFLSATEDNFDQAINLSLAQLGQLFEVDRSYLFQFSEDFQYMSNSHEWCASGIIAQKNRIQNLPSNSLAGFFQAIQKGPVHIPDVNKLSDVMKAEKQEWQAQGIQSLVCIPVYGVHQQILGFIGFDAVAQPYFWPDDQIAMLRVLADIIGGAIERKETEAKLRLAASVFTNAREGIIITDPHGSIININDTFSKLTGYGRAELLGKNLRMFKSRLQSKEFYFSLWDDLINKGHWSGELWNHKKNGKLYAQMATLSAVCDSQGNTKHFVGLFSDITAQKQQQRQLEHIAHYDALTNLPNRILLADRMLQSMRQAKRHNSKLAVVYIDLDGFKEVNDTYGHDIGDKLLVSISRHMQENLREEDTISRLGGDEFVAVLINLKHEDESIPLLIRLLEAVSKPINIGQFSLKVSASLGVTFYPQKEEVDADQLLRQADQSMYQAKLSGKNRYQLFDEAQARDIRVHHESIERIQQALIAEEFILYYQPKVNMRSGEILGVEALLRWQHPELGLVPPMDFLPTIKNHPLAIEVDKWVIHQALEQLTEWHQQGLDWSISVNISPSNLQKTNFVQQLKDLLAKFPKVDPHLLELEVLESSAFEDIQQVSQLISNCRELGIEFALDDFGTGYSSLSYLQRLPASLLKIDQSFIRFMLENPDDLAIIEAILSLAQAFRRKVIAEGVETIEHGDVLLQMGCDLGQGFGIAHPMPVDSLIKWAKDWQPDPSWRDSRIVPREKFSLLFYEIKHRSWVYAMDAYLNNKSTFVPELDSHCCLLGAWIDNEGGKLYAENEDFSAMLLIHQQIHKLAEKLVRYKKQQVSERIIKEGIVSIHLLKEGITSKLRKLMY